MTKESIRVINKISRSKKTIDDVIYCINYLKNKINNKKIIDLSKIDILKKTKIYSGSRDRYRELVRIRDKHICQICGKKWNIGERRFDIHHIIGDNEDTKKCDKDFNNMITLCHDCHLKVDSYKMTDYLGFINKQKFINEI